MLDGFRKKRANAHNEEGRVLLDDGDLDGAQAAFERALHLDPELGWAWFNLGIVHKRRRDWPDVVRCNRQAVTLTGGGAEDPAWWNLGIAATALRDWPTAREAWRTYGIPIGDGAGPIDENFGMAPIRIDPQRNPEVVWAQRIDPARAVIRSVPLPDSGHRWGDCVLHDGEPKGERMLEGKPRSVFDEIELWESSGVPTVQAWLDCATPDDSSALSHIFSEADGAAEDWTKEVNLLCKACSEGRVDVPHDHARDGGWSTERHFGLAADEDEARRLLDEWVSASPDTRALRSVERAL